MCGSENGQEINGYIKEYDNLRTEIMEDIKLYNSLTTLMLTAVVAFLGYLISENTTSFILYFIPVPIVMAVSSRTLYYRRKICEISAYMIVFIESSTKDLKWETRNNEFENNVRIADSDIEIMKKFFNLRIVKFCRRILKYTRYTEFLALIFTCFIAYCYKLFSSIGTANLKIIMMTLSLKNYIIIAFILAIFIEFIMTIDMNQTSVYREQCIEQWKKIKQFH